MLGMIVVTSMYLRGSCVPLIYLQQVKKFLMEAKLPDPRPLIHVCDRHDFIEEMTGYLYKSSLQKYIEVRIPTLPTYPPPVSLYHDVKTLLRHVFFVLCVCQTTSTFVARRRASLQYSEFVCMNVLCRSGVDVCIACEVCTFVLICLAHHKRKNTACVFWGGVNTTVVWSLIKNEEKWRAKLKKRLRSSPIQHMTNRTQGRRGCISCPQYAVELCAFCVYFWRFDTWRRQLV